MIAAGVVVTAVVCFVRSMLDCRTGGSVAEAEFLYMACVGNRNGGAGNGVST